MPECVKLIASAKITALEKMRFELALYKTFCNTPPPITHRRLKHRQRTKINKTMLSASPLIGFPHKVHNIKIEKQISIPS